MMKIKLIIYTQKRNLKKYFSWSELDEIGNIDIINSPNEKKITIILMIWMKFYYMAYIVILVIIFEFIYLAFHL